MLRTQLNGEYREKLNPIPVLEESAVRRKVFVLDYSSKDFTFEREENPRILVIERQKRKLCFQIILSTFILTTRHKIWQNNLSKLNIEFLFK